MTTMTSTKTNTIELTRDGRLVARVTYVFRGRRAPRRVVALWQESWQSEAEELSCTEASDRMAEALAE